MKKILNLFSSRIPRFISPAFPPSCRYYPTCSNYMIQAIRTHGALKGTLMGNSTHLRCPHFVKGGIDYALRNFLGLTRNKEDQSMPDYKKYKK